MLLNNDAVVTEGWLDQLIALSSMRIESTAEAEPAGSGGLESTLQPDRARRFRRKAGLQRIGRTEPTRAAVEPVSEDRGPHARAGIGLVGPMSNYAAPPQLVEDVPYRDLDEMHAFARRWRDEHRGQWFTAAKLSGFCLLMKRAVYDAIGGLDERFGLGLFDDDDLAERARRAGFELAVAHDLFVHHFGSRTFAGNGIDAERLLEENARRFAEKWGQDAPRGRRVALRSLAAGRPRSGGAVPGRRGLRCENPDSDSGFRIAPRSHPCDRARGSDRAPPRVRPRHRGRRPSTATPGSA